MTIDEQILSSIKAKSPLMASKPLDMYGYSNLQNRAELNQGFPQPGIHKFLNEPEKQRSDPNYKEFYYHINDMGFRDRYPSQEEKNILAFFGCSCTFGEGVASEDIFVHHVGSFFNKKILNLGMPGSSASRIALNFSAAVRIWNIDTAIITLPNWGRFLYVSSENYMYNIVPAHPTQPIEAEEVRKSLVEKFSEQHLMFAFKDAITFIIEIAKANDIKLILGCWCAESREISYHATGYYPSFFELFPSNANKARDIVHPGIEAHYSYSQNLIRRMKNNEFIVS